MSLDSRYAINRGFVFNRWCDYCNEAHQYGCLLTYGEKKAIDLLKLLVEAWSETKTTD